MRRRVERASLGSDERQEASIRCMTSAASEMFSYNALVLQRRHLGTNKVTQYRRAQCRLLWTIGTFRNVVFHWIVQTSMEKSTSTKWCTLGIHLIMLLNVYLVTLILWACQKIIEAVPCATPCLCRYERALCDRFFEFRSFHSKTFFFEHLSCSRAVAPFFHEVVPETWNWSRHQTIEHGFRRLSG